MATTVPGGRYLNADGKTWVDAEGRVIPAPVEAPVEPEAPADVKPEPEPAPAKKSK